MKAARSRHSSLRRGHAVVEVALFAPWIFFLFAGALDAGFYTYALISTENAARVAAEYTSKSSATAADASTACTYALDEMNTMSNVKSLASCNSLPLIVTASPVTSTDGSSASAVSVKYQTAMLVPIPGLPGRITITRKVQMMLKNL
jgi:Flp pilus assembly protein TadG